MFPKILKDCHRIINVFSYQFKKKILMFDLTVILFAITLSSVMLVLHGSYANSDRLDCGNACWNKVLFIHSFSILSDERFIDSSKTIPPHSAI